MLRLLRLRFWKSEPLRPIEMSRPAPNISTIRTSAPQSASWRTAVGPERTRVRSRTLKRASGRSVTALVTSRSTSARNDPTMALNAAGSSRLMAWPVCGWTHSPAVGIARLSIRFVSRHGASSSPSASSTGTVMAPNASWKS